MSRVVRSAGGVLGRDLAEGRQVLLVHRPRYDDWSLPKGKLSTGEHPLAAAVREVQEETGVHGIPQLCLPSTRYLTGVPGVEKAVEYWAMRPAGANGAAAQFTPNDEVDEVRWVAVEEAGALLTYAHDRGVVAAYGRVRPVSGLVVLVRHAEAGRRDEWPGPDHDRPLDATGARAAQALAPLLALFAPAHVICGTALRCVQTVEPLARATSAPLRTDDAFDETADPAAAAEAVRALAGSGATAVVCSQGKLIPPVLRLLTGRGTAPVDTAKGTGWVLAFAGQQLLAADRLDPSA